MTQQPNSKSTRTRPPRARAVRPSRTRFRRAKFCFGVVLALLIFAVIAATGILRRVHGDTVLAQRTDELAPPTVNVADAPSRARPPRPLCCPAT